jgi:hypothetical protein
MYGIVIGDQTDPYVTGNNLDQLRHIAEANKRLGHDTHLVLWVNECWYCDDGLPGGWVEVDAQGDFIDYPMHDRCVGYYMEERRIDA